MSSNRLSDQSSRHKVIAKRLEITDDEGWTHVTKSNAPVARKFKAKARLNTVKPIQLESSTEPLLSPAEAPPRTTIVQLRKQYAVHLERWKSSSAWECAQTVLQSQGSPSLKSLRNVVCIGLGSPSGLVRGGWVDRRSVALDQLAALNSILDVFRSIGSPNIQAYAQDPVFNSLDKELLASIGITVVEHPAAFDLVDHLTFLYCPGAEKTHIEQLLPRKPPLVFGGPLENSYDYDENEILTTFVHARQSVALPQFEPHPEAFWKMRLYWKRESE